MNITLNGSTYSVRNKKSKESLVNPISEPIRFAGSTTRKDNYKLESSIYDDWANKGIFWRHMRREKDRGIGGIWKSTADTRFEESIYQQLLEEAQTNSWPNSHLIRYVNFKSALWGVFEPDYTSSVLSGATAASFDASSDTWTGGLMPTISGTASGAGGAASTRTVSKTVQSTYGGRLAIVFVVHESASDPTGVTEAGNALTKHGSRSQGSDFNISIWYKINPTTGTQDYVASGLSGESAVVVLDLFGCATASPLRAIAETASGGATSSSCAPASEAGDLVIGGLAHTVGSADTTTSGAGQTELVDLYGGGDMGATVSHEPAHASDSTTTHTYSWSGSEAMASLAFSVKGGGSIATTDLVAEGIRVFDACVHKGKIYVIGSRGSDELKYMVWSSPDGSAWTEVGNSAFPTGDLLTTTITRRNNFDDDMARLYDDGNMLWAFVRDIANDEIEVLTSVDAGANWVAEFVVTSAYGPKGVVRWFDRAGTSRVLLGTAEGIHALDDTNNRYETVFATDGQAANCRFMVVGDDGQLYVPLAEDDILQISLGGKVAEGIFSWAVTRIGPMSAHDGVPAEWRGHANYLMSGNSVGGQPSQWLWVAFGGNAASTTATILCYDYERSRNMGHPVWHCVHDAQENSISGIAQNVDFTMLGLSGQNDATTRLHCSAEGTAGSLMFHLEEPLVSHEVLGLSKKYQLTSYLQFAEDDHGDPNKEGAMYRANIVGTGMANASTNTHKIVWNYGLQQGEWDDVAGGTFYSDVLSLSLGSGAGVVMKESMHQLTLTTNSTSTRVNIREFEVLWRKRYSTLEEHSFIVDLHESSVVDATVKDGDTETVISNLKTVRDLSVNAPFVIGGSGTLYVEVAGLSFDYDLIDFGDGRQQGIRKGTASLILHETE